AGDSSFYQQITVPGAAGTLAFFHWDCTNDILAHDWQDAYITDSKGNLLQTIFHQCSNARTWIPQFVNMAPYAGQTVRLKFLVHQNGSGNLSGMYIDDVELYAPCPSPTPSCTPGSWQSVANMPTDVYGAASASIWPNGYYFYTAGGYSFSQG